MSASLNNDSRGYHQNDFTSLYTEQFNQACVQLIFVIADTKNMSDYIDHTIYQYPNNFNQTENIALN